LNTIYKIIVEETKIKKVFFLSQKINIISYESVESFEKEFINDVYSPKGGKISPRYYRCKFLLKEVKKLIVSPLYFKNCDQLAIEINHNRNT
jgi:hypothetical protein